MRWIVVLIIVTLPNTLFAQEKKEQVEALMEGQAAPYSGLLVPEKKFTELMNKELEVQDMNGQLKAKDLYIESLEDLYMRASEPTKRPWHENLQLNRAVFFLVGITVAILSVWGGVKVVEATNS